MYHAGIATRSAPPPRPGEGQPPEPVDRSRSWYYNVAEGTILHKDHQCETCKEWRMHYRAHARDESLTRGLKAREAGVEERVNAVREEMDKEVVAVRR